MSAPVVVIAGPPAAGKGTQCDKIKEKFGYVHISTGDILRQNIRLGTELGEKAKPFMDAGELVPSELLVDLVKARLQEPDVQQKGCLLDGFPRAPDQAQAMVDAALKVDKFIVIKVPDDTLVERGVGRRLDPETGAIYHMTFKPPPEDILERLVHRSDDHEEQIRNRLKTYHEQVAGILPFFQDVLIEVDGTAAPDDVFGSISASLESMRSGKGRPHATLVFSRHGESEWNLANKFTGWVDVDLSEKGRGEAKNAGQLVKDAGISFDVCYTSYLKRAIKTCNLALENSDQLHVPVIKSWRLNERMYGGLTGLDKKETVVKHGAEQVAIWRRSFDLPPPDIEEDSEYHPKKEPKYKDLSPADIPKTESLKTVIERVMPFWESSIMADLKAGKTVFVAAHGNSIRAIVKYLENIPDDVIPGLEIPTGTPLVYELDEELKPLPNDLAVEPLKAGKYLGDLEAIKAAAEKVKNQTKV